MMQLARWQGRFGTEYTGRNPADEEAILRRTHAFAEILKHIAPASILEIGANVGINLLALRRLTEAPLYAIEPNETAYKSLVDCADEAANTDLSAIPFNAELVFTSGVLIHLPDDQLRPAYDAIYAASRRYILAMEYFSPTPVTVPYRGHDDMLFKRDYGGLWLDWFNVEPVANGFFWKRTTGVDDVTWWLFRKSG